ncbi:putative disease resistance protein [Glycine soja]
MAAAVVGGAFLSAFLDVVFDRLASPEFVNLIHGKKLSKKLLQKLETILRVHLGFFIVGKHKENGIKELGALSNLHGQLRISNLENISQSDEALEARIMDKKHINSLWLEWSRCNNESTNFQIEIDILCRLQPHYNLELLSIRGYKGTKFPNWMGDFSYCKMTHLTLRDCHNCCMLPSLGQLPSLKVLEISRLNRLKTIDAGFYKNKDYPSVTPFSSLESLAIYYMTCWEVWSSFDSEAFPVLHNLIIHNCPKLKGDLPNHLPALETLQIINCELLVSSLPMAPAIRTLEIRKSNKVALHVFPLLVENIVVEGSSMVESMIEAITNIQPTCLRSLALNDCSSAISFPGGRLPESLKTLFIRNLKKLEFPAQHKHELLEVLSILWSCDSLTSLPSVTFPNFKNLELENCKNIESLLVSRSESFKSLSAFGIRKCPNFVSFPREGLHAPNLSSFIVLGCDKLKSLPDKMSTLLPKLEHLHIENCPGIQSFPEGGMPPNLRTVWIVNCEKLLCGLAWPSMDMLTHLILAGPCDSIKSFPKEGLLPPSLTFLNLCNFSSMETLDCKGLLNLTSLQELRIVTCPKLENIAGEKLPVSLIKLIIEECPFLQKQCRTKHHQIWPKISHICGIKRPNMVDWSGETVPTHGSEFKFEQELNYNIGEGKGIPTPDVKYSCNNIWRSCRSRGIGRIAIILVWFCLSHQRIISRTSETGSNDPSQGDLRWKNYLWPQENFSDKNLIGEWEIWGGILGFTSRWNACSYQKTPRTCYQEFVDEVHYLSSIRRRNLVSLLGYCQENNLQFLIYEYATN